MNQTINLKTIIIAVRNLIHLATAGCGFLLVVLALACSGLLRTARAVTPAPDGGYSGNNTAEGTNALKSLTSAADNTAIGFQALFSNTTGATNTATGAFALHNKTARLDNTPNAPIPLEANTTAS